jgi:hypothetical protein
MRGGAHEFGGPVRSPTSHLPIDGPHGNTEVLKTGIPTASTSEQRREKWCKPPVDVLKLNCDVSLLPSSSSGSWGFLIRDDAGDVVITGRGKVDHLLSAMVYKRQWTWGLGT